MLTLECPWSNTVSSYPLHHIPLLEQFRMFQGMHVYSIFHKADQKQALRVTNIVVNFGECFVKCFKESVFFLCLSDIVCKYVLGPFGL